MTLSPRQHAAVRRKWRRWINVIGPTVSELCADDHVFQESMRVIDEERPFGPGNVVYRWILRSYATHLALGIRRLLDKDNRTYSLFHLIHSISRNPQVISRRSFVGSYGAAIRHLGEADFDALAGRGSHFLPEEVPLTDLLSLEQHRRRLAPVIDRVIAHRERARGPLPKRSWREFHAAVAEVDRICTRYRLVLHQEGTSTMRPHIVPLAEDLRQAWSRDRGSSSRQSGY